MNEVYVVFYTKTVDGCLDKEFVNSYAMEKDAFARFHELVILDKNGISEKYDYDESDDYYESWDTNDGYPHNHCRIWIRKLNID